MIPAYAIDELQELYDDLVEEKRKETDAIAYRARQLQDIEVRLNELSSAIKILKGASSELRSNDA